MTKNVKSLYTMQALANDIGVSRQTLSKYFNSPELIGEKTRAKIQTAIKETGFQPNLFASNLKREKSKVIGFIIPSNTDPFYMKLVSEISTYAEKKGYFILTFSSKGNLSLEADALARLHAMNVAGVFIVPLGKAGHVQTVLRRIEENIPIVYLDSPPSHQANFVGADNQQGITQLVNYLCQMNRPPAFLAMPDINRNASTRLDSYLNAMAANHEKPYVITNLLNDWKFESQGYIQAQKWLSSVQNRGSALLCANDRLAFGALLAAWEAHLTVGNKNSDLSIVGHDDHPLAAYTCPPLTTVSQNSALIAQTAVNLLLALITSDQAMPTAHLTPMSIIKRKSA